MDIKRAKIRELRKALDSKEISAAELCGEYFKRIEAVDPQLLSYITVTKEKAMQDAENAQKLIDAGKSAPLTGIPLAVKDNICIDGVRTTCASRMLENFIPPYNATVIEKMNEQGYVLLGRASMDEFAMGGSTQTSAFAKTKTPTTSNAFRADPRAARRRRWALRSRLRLSEATRAARYVSPARSAA